MLKETLIVVVTFTGVFGANLQRPTGEAQSIRVTGIVHDNAGKPVSGKVVFFLPVPEPGRVSVELAIDGKGSAGCDREGNGVANPRGKTDASGNFSIDVPKSSWEKAANFTIGTVQPSFRGCVGAGFLREDKTAVFPSTGRKSLAVGVLIAP